MFEESQFSLRIIHVVAHFYLVARIKLCEIDDISDLLKRLKKIGRRK
jgi:hypothetical protein